MRRARVLGATLITLALVAFLVERATRLARHGHSRGHRASRAHPHFVVHVSADHFQRGNVHTHSLVSDGTVPLEAMVGWYRDHGYQFVAMTEHNLRVDPNRVADLTGPGFVVIPGEEVTDRAAGRPLHVNALCAGQDVEGGRDFDRADLGLGVMLAQIRAASGTPLINHPNYQGSLTADDIERGAAGRYLLEVWSGHPDVATEGNAWRSSAEAVWDDVLAQGGDAIPAAVDDAHGLPSNSGGPHHALPGQAWVETFGAETTVDAICAALDAGSLYASNGPVLSRITVQGDAFTVTTTDAGASITFLGDGGAILSEMHAPSATYRLTGEEGLVRARVADTGGHHAWTAAYRTGD